jgi:hypothetical protein
MAVIALASAKGAPGVTTTALALTLTWPRPALLVEADLAGSSILSGFYRGHLPHDRGLRELAIIHAHGEFDHKLPEQMMQLGEGDSTKRFLPGIPSPKDAPAVTNLWSDLTNYLVSLDRAGIDVIVDLGRLSALADPREVLLRLADQVLVVTSSRMPDILVTREITQAHTSPDLAVRELSNMALLVVGPGRPYATSEIAGTIGLPPAGEIAWDPATAEVFSVGAKPSRKYATTALARSLTPTIDAINRRISARRARLTTPQESA